MIKKYGQVVVRSSGIEIRGFTFEYCGDMKTGSREALEWAKEYIEEELKLVDNTNTGHCEFTG